MDFTLERCEMMRIITVTAILTSMLISASMALCGDSAQIVFVFGKVEAFRVEKGEWGFLKSGELLRGEDIIRMPPGAILRLKDDRGEMLPVFTGSREQKVSEMIAIGRNKLEKLKIENVASNGIAAVDALPAGSYSPAERKVSTEVYTKLSKDEVETLERSIESLIPDLCASVSKLIPAAKLQISKAERGYPPPNLLQASLIFGILFDDEIYPRLASQVRNILPVRDEELEKLVVYRLLLGCVGVEARLEPTKDGIVYLSIDSGLRRNQIRLITANKNLVISNDKLMIPIWIRLDKPNFTYAWYRGAKLVREGPRL